MSQKYKSILAVISARKASRMDFLLKDKQIVVETKFASKNHSDKEIGTELIDDTARYKEHPDCQVLSCFIYDPERQMRNPRGFENDLTSVKNIGKALWNF